MSDKVQPGVNLVVTALAVAADIVNQLDPVKTEEEAKKRAELIYELWNTIQSGGKPAR